MVKIEKSKIKQKKNKLIILIIVLSGFLILSLLTAFIAGFFPIQNQLITRQVISFLKQKGVDSCSIGQLRITPWKYAEFAEFYIRGAGKNGDSYIIKIDHCLMYYDIHTLLKQVHVIKKMAAFTNYFRNITSEDPLHSIQEMFLFAKNVAGITMFDGNGCHVNCKRNNSSQVFFDNANLQFILKNDSVYEGKISADTLIALNHILSSVQSGISFNNNMVSFRECRGKILDGSFLLNGNIDLNKRRFKSMEWTADSLSIDQFYTSGRKYAGKISGTAQIAFRMDDTPLSIDSLCGNGTVTASDVKFVNVPLQKAICSLLGVPSLTMVGFDTVRTGFEIKSGNDLFITIHGKGPVLDISSSGWIKPSGALNQNIEGVFTNTFVRTLPSMVTGSMIETTNNGRMFKCRIYGTIDHPKIELSKETLNKAIGNVFESMKQDLQGYFTGK